MIMLHIDTDVDTITYKKTTVSSGLFVCYIDIENNELRGISLQKDDKSTECLYYFRRPKEIENMRDLLTGVLEVLNKEQL